MNEKFGNMFELTKKILKNVSFDSFLFQKELNKALKWITDAEEMKRFREWCIVEFGAVYPVIIKNTFNSYKAIEVKTKN